MKKAWDYFKNDYYRMTGITWSARFGITNILFQHAIRYMFYLRILQFSHCRLTVFVLELFRRRLQLKYGLEIHKEVSIGVGFRLIHAYNITINSQVRIGNNVNIYKGATIGYSCGKHSGVPVLGSRIQIGANSTVVGGVIIGDDVIIAPNSFVNFDVPDHSIVIGNPAIVIPNENATMEYVYNIV